MVFLRLLVDNVVEAIFDKEFVLLMGDESYFEDGNDIHALLGKTVLRRKDVIGGY